MKSNPDICPAELLRLHPEIGQHVIAGFKQGFCVVPEVSVCDPAPEPNPLFDCEYQGIDAGWSDVYCIDISGVPRGRYILEIDVNSERRIQESDYGNNSASIAVDIP